jgi:lipoprotein-releasing system permease protein
MEEQAHGFILMLNDASIADPFSTQLQNELGYPYYPRSWRESHASLFAWFQSQQYPIVLVFGLIAVVAIFNIMSTLMMIVLEKTKNIGLLKAVGSTNQSIMRIFVYNGLFIGFIGCFAGTSLGLLLGELQRRFNLLQLPADVYFMASVPIEFNWEHILIINGVLMFFAVIASLYPSLRAAKREPVETLTYE